MVHKASGRKAILTGQDIDEMKHRLFCTFFNLPLKENKPKRKRKRKA